MEAGLLIASGAEKEKLPRQGVLGIAIGVINNIRGKARQGKIIYFEVEKMRCCDYCLKLLEYHPVMLIFGYGSSVDGNTYEFCSDKCFVAWIRKNDKMFLTRVKK